MVDGVLVGTGAGELSDDTLVRAGDPLQISADSPAARYLESHGVLRADFNSYGSRRGNHEVMMRGTFANIRIKNLLAPGVEGGMTKYLSATGEDEYEWKSCTINECYLEKHCYRSPLTGAMECKDWEKVRFTGK